MKKILTLIPFFAFAFFLFVIGSNVSSCTKKSTEIVTDTVIKTVRDTVTIVTIDTIPAINLKQGLVAYYPFNGNANDSSGNNNNGTSYGNLTYTTDKNSKSNSAVQFDGTSSYILVNDNGTLLNSNSFTITAQFYCSTNVHQNMMSKIQYATSNGAIMGISPFGGASSYPGDMGFTLREPGAACNVSESTQVGDVVFAMENISLNTWYQITCVFDQGKQKIFLNGVLRNAVTRDFTVPKECTQSQLIFGSWWQGDPLFYNGKLDEVRIYNRALNYREIQQLATGF